MKVFDTIVSTCCQAEVDDTDIDICPECLEHCDFETIKLEKNDL